LFTDAGYAVAALDAQGFGRSDGLDGYIPNFDHLISDAREFFRTVRDSDRFKALPHFLYGESMGGANALLISFEEPGQWTGAVLSAPMVKVSHRPVCSMLFFYLLPAHLVGSLCNSFYTWS
jgi:acylglycerol lipase